MTSSEQLRLKTLDELVLATDLPANTLIPVLVPGSSTLKKAELSSIRQILQIATTLSTTTIQASGNADSVLLSLAFTPISDQSTLIFDICINSITVNGSSNAGAISLGWGGVVQQRLASGLSATSASESSRSGGSTSSKLIYTANHNGLTGTRTYNIFGRTNTVSGFLQTNAGGGISSLTITEILL